MSFLFKKTEKKASRGRGRRGRGGANAAQPRATPQVPQVTEPKESDEEVLAKLEPYFYEKEVDPVDIMLQALPDEGTEAYLDELLDVRRRQLEIINSRLSESVMSNYDAFVQGMMKIKELGDDLKTTAVLCRNGRASLHKANHDLISGPLTIISTNRKRIVYQRLLEYLLEIKRIQGAEQQLKQLIEDGDYPAAIELCTQCSADISKYQAFHAVRSLSSKVQESYNLVQEQLDFALLDVTRSFDERTYGRLLRAFHLSGKSHVVLSKLQVNFKDSVKNGTKGIIYAHVIMCEANLQKAGSLKKMGLQALCGLLHEDHFKPCLQVMLEYLCDLMFSHYQMREWHRKKEKEAAEEAEQYQDIRRGLETYGKSIWLDMQGCLIAILKNSSLPTFKIDVFLDVLDNVNKLTREQLIELGEDFSDSKSVELKNCINQQSRNYFEHFHQQKAEDLKTMLENEMWEVMPVDDDFSIHDLKEYKTLARQAGFETSKASSSGLLRNAGSSALSLSSGVSPMASLYGTGNPFSKERLRQLEKEAAADNDSDEEVDAALMADYVDEDDSNLDQPLRKKRRAAEQKGKKGPILTSTCINLTKYFGKYLQTMSTLKPIAYDVFIGATQLFDFYMFCTFFFFGKKLVSNAPVQNSATASINRYLTSFRTESVPEVNHAANSPDAFIEGLQNVTLRSAFTRIHATLIKAPLPDEKYERFVMQVPMLNEHISIESEKNMYGLNKRAVAVESLMFLEAAMLELKPYILQLIPPNHRQHCVQFYENSVNMATLVRNEIYGAVAERFVNLSSIVPQIERIKWNTSEVNLNHNPYVNTLTKEFKQLHRKLMAIRKKGVVSEEACHMMLDCAIYQAMELLIEGYSHVKKCTVEGRTMMALDCQIFQTELPELTPTRPIPHSQEVDAYIKAFYSNDLVDWIRKHAREYSERQLLGLAVCAGANMGRKQRQDLLKQVEEVTSRNK